jgi:hypothetical protein
MKEKSSDRRRVRTIRGASVALALLASAPASAVVILDGTWRDQGGAPGYEWVGFAAHLKLASEPQFRGVLALASDGETWGEASGTWIGNDDTHGWVLTAAHVFDLPARPDAYVERAPNGSVMTATPNPAPATTWRSCA